MKIKVLVIGVVKNGDTVLLCKKPDGSVPYKEAWYLFGGELNDNNPNPEEVIKEVLEKQAGLHVMPTQPLGWDTEIKADHDGETKLFVYLDYQCEYQSGDLAPVEGIEKLEWVSILELKNYDLVPPSKKLFAKLGYL